MIIFDVVVPTVDVYSDLSLIITWYMQGHWKYASAMLIPVLLNFLATCYTWWRLEKKKDKKLTWILLVAQVWPQYRAIKVIVHVLRSHPGAEEKKKLLLRELGGLEPFLESAPSILILTVVFVHALESDGVKVRENRKNFMIVFGDGSAQGMALFFTTYAVSIVAGSFGITKFLLNGPCRVMPEGGSFGGLCTGRFILAYFAIMFTSMGKSTLLALVTAIGECPVRNLLLTFLGLNVLPQLIISVVCVSQATGCTRKLFKVFFNYPAICLLPTLTYFTVAPRSRRCCRTRPEEMKCRQLILSTKASALNMLLSPILFGTTLPIVWSFSGCRPDALLLITLMCLPLLLAGLIFTAIFLSIDLNCCLNCHAKMQMCCCLCCCSKDSCEIQRSYINTSPNNDDDFDIELCELKEQNQCANTNGIKEPYYREELRTVLKNRSFGLY